MKRNTVLVWILLLLLTLACSPASPAGNEVSEEPSLSPEPSKSTPAVRDDANGLPFTLWQEPQAGAFTANVPADWLITGGVNDTAGMLHPWMELAAPDGNALVQYGYGALQFYLLPHPSLREAGYPVGATIPLENGAVISVADYQSGEQAAEAAIRAGLQPACPDLTIDYARNLDSFTVEGIDTSAGVVGFHCTVEGERLTGETYATTRKILSDDAETGVWFSDSAIGYLALSGHEARAEEALSALSDSLRFNPQWAAGLNAIPGVPNLYYSIPEQSASSQPQFFEDQMFNWFSSH